MDFSNINAVSVRMAGFSDAPFTTSSARLLLTTDDGSELLLRDVFGHELGNAAAWQLFRFELDSPANEVYLRQGDPRDDSADEVFEPYLEPTPAPGNFFNE